MIAIACNYTQVHRVIMTRRHDTTKAVDAAMVHWLSVVQYIHDIKDRRDDTSQQRLYSFCTVFGILLHDKSINSKEVVLLLSQHAKSNTSYAASYWFGSNRFASTLSAITSAITKKQYTASDLKQAVDLYAAERREQFEAKDDAWSTAARIRAISANCHIYLKQAKRKRPSCSELWFNVYDYLQERRSSGGDDADYRLRLHSLYAIFAFVEFADADIDQNIAFLREQARCATTWIATTGLGSCRYATLLHTLAEALERGDFSFNTYLYSILPLRDHLTNTQHALTDDEDAASNTAAASV